MDPDKQARIDKKVAIMAQRVCQSPGAVGRPENLKIRLVLNLMAIEREGSASIPARIWRGNCKPLHPQFRRPFIRYLSKY